LVDATAYRLDERLEVLRPDDPRPADFFEAVLRPDEALLDVPRDDDEDLLADLRPEEPLLDAPRADEDLLADLRPLEAELLLDLRPADLRALPVDFLLAALRAPPVDLRPADLRPADLLEADLRPVDLLAVDLRPADLRPVEPRVPDAARLTALVVLVTARLAPATVFLTLRVVAAFLPAATRVLLLRPPVDFFEAALRVDFFVPARLLVVLRFAAATRRRAPVTMSLTASLVDFATRATFLRAGAVAFATALPAFLAAVATSLAALETVVVTVSAAFDSVLPIPLLLAIGNTPREASLGTGTSMLRCELTLGNPAGE
jgi:hypothetical protein